MHAMTPHCARNITSMGSSSSGSRYRRVSPRSASTATIGKTKIGPSKKPRFAVPSGARNARRARSPMSGIGAKKRAPAQHSASSNEWRKSAVSTSITANHCAGGTRRASYRNERKNCE